MEPTILSSRGKPKFTHNGFVYTFEKCSKTSERVKFWRCEQQGRCKVRIHTEGGEVIKVINVHSHSSSAARVEVAEVITKIKLRAENTVEGTINVINNCLTNLTQGSEASIPNIGALRKVVRRKRNAINSAPAAPVTLQELVLPEAYTTYFPDHNTAENFLLCDSGVGPSRILIFGRLTWIQHLQTSTWYADGTFTIAPTLFAQVYIIMAERFGGVLPIIYALLPNKQQETYIRMFNLIKELQNNLSPNSIICDFEQAAFGAMAQCFPGVSIKGCFFHLAQNMRKHIAGLGLINRYNTDPDFCLKAKMIIALAFVRVDDLDDYLEPLSEELPGELHPVLNWFEDNYIGRMNRRGNGRRQPLFPQEMWNLYDRTLDGDDRTNNHSEAANRRLKSELGMEHPTIWKFIDGLRKVQKGRDTYYEQLVAGNQPPLKLKKYRDADERILRIVTEYGNRTPLEYLRGIAHNYQMSE